MNNRSVSFWQIHPVKYLINQSKTFIKIHIAMKQLGLITCSIGLIHQRHCVTVKGNLSFHKQQIESCAGASPPG